MQQIKGWNKGDLLAQAVRTKTPTTQDTSIMLENSIYIEQNYNDCFGMLMMEKKYTAQRLETACTRALQGSRVNYAKIKNILQKSPPKQAILFASKNIIPSNTNIRSKDIYQ